MDWKYLEMVDSDAAGNQLVLHTSWGGSWTNTLSPSHLNTNQWYHVVGTYNGANMRLYNRLVAN
jgi:hypothetical protein